MSGAKRIGVFGGTFDPVHIGHLIAASEVRNHLGLDEVLMVVANSPWKKAGRDVAPPRDRFEVLCAALEGCEGLTASDLEIKRGGASYTYETLEQLKSDLGPVELFMIVGSDLADELVTWEHSESLKDLATLVVVSRPGAELPTILLGWQMVNVEVPLIGVSSTDIRSRIRDGRPIDFLLPRSAVNKITSLGMYTGAS